MATPNSTTAKPGGDPQHAPSRRALLTGAASLPVLGAPEASRASLPGAGGADAELLALASALRRAEKDYAAAVELDDSDRSPAIDAADERIDSLAKRMKDTLAEGFAGVAAKAGHVVVQLAVDGSCSLPNSYVGIAESLGADLARLMPAALPTAPVFSDPDADLPEATGAEPRKWPEPPYMRELREEVERLASLGCPRPYFTGGEVQLVGWLCRRVEADMGRGAAERVRELSAMPAERFGPDWRTFLDEIADQKALSVAEAAS